MAENEVFKNFVCSSQMARVGVLTLLVLEYIICKEY